MHDGPSPDWFPVAAPFDVFSVQYLDCIMTVLGCSLFAFLYRLERLLFLLFIGLASRSPCRDERYGTDHRGALQDSARAQGSSAGTCTTLASAFSRFVALDEVRDLSVFYSTKEVENVTQRG